MSVTSPAGGVVSRRDWPVLLFASLSPLVALVGTAWWGATGRFHPATLVLAGVMAVATGLGVTGGYHRLFSHRTFEAPWPVRLVLLLFGGAAIEESALRWSWDHRRHHRYVDTDADPYGVQRGFWHAHFLWMLRKRAQPPTQGWPADLWNDPLVRLQHRVYLPSAVFVSLVLPFAIACLWGDPWGGLLVAGLARIVINQHLTFAINSVCHTLGSQPYSDRHTARDNWLTAFFTYGEGFHNFHHEFASDYRNGHRPHHYDPTKWMIELLARMGLVRNLRRCRREVIAMRRIAMQEKRASARLQAGSHAARGLEARRLGAARARVDAAFATLQNVRRLRRREAIAAAATPGDDSRLRTARRDFERAVATWNATVARV